jgi:hypothetical protein
MIHADSIRVSRPSTADEVRQLARAVSRRLAAQRAVPERRSMREFVPLPEPGSSAPTATRRPLALAPEIARLASPERVIIRIVAERFGVTVADIMGSERSHRGCRPRHAAMWIARQLLPHRSLPALGRRFGGKDHTTVISAIKRVDRLMADNPMFSAVVEYCGRAAAETLELEWPR